VTALLTPLPFVAVTLTGGKAACAGMTAVIVVSFTTVKLDAPATE
jgi:hypothetical protein